MTRMVQRQHLRAMLSIILLWGAITGCTSSVHPLFNGADLSQDLDLTGKWQTIQPESQGNANTFTLQQFAENRHYDVILTNGEQKDDILQLGKIAGQRFLQVRGANGDDGPPLVSGLPVYTFAKIEVNGDELKLYPLDDTRALTHVQQHKVAHLIYEQAGGKQWTVLTATTAELQQLVSQHGAQLFADKPIIWRRERSTE